MKHKISIEILRHTPLVGTLLNHLKANGYEISSAVVTRRFYDGRYFPVFEFYVPCSQADKLYEYLVEFYFADNRCIIID